MGIKTLLDGIKNLVSYGEGEGKWDMGELGQTLWQNRPTMGFAIGDNAGQVASHSAASKMAQRREQMLLSEQEKKAERVSKLGGLWYSASTDLDEPQLGKLMQVINTGELSDDEKVNKHAQIMKVGADAMQADPSEYPMGIEAGLKLKEMTRKFADNKKLVPVFNQNIKQYENIPEQAGALGQGIIPTSEYDPYKTPEAMAQNRQSELSLAQEKANIQAMKEKGLIDYRIGKEKQAGVGDKQYAPDMTTYINGKTKEVKEINSRDIDAINEAKANGFQPISPSQQGYLQEEGKSGAKYADEIAQNSQKAQGTITTLTTMDNLLDRFQSGKIANISKNVQQWATALGLPIDATNLSSKEAFTALGEQLALQSRNLGEGMVLAGQMSDRDVQFLRDMNPQMLISKGGNKQIVKIRKALAQRNVESAKLAKEYRDENGGVLDSLGFQEYQRQKMGSTSIFGIPDGATIAGTDKVTGLPVYKVGDKLHIPNF
jgi:hypothetical protein